MNPSATPTSWPSVSHTPGHSLVAQYSSHMHRLQHSARSPVRGHSTSTQSCCTLLPHSGLSVPPHRLLVRPPQLTDEEVGERVHVVVGQAHALEGGGDGPQVLVRLAVP